MDRGVMGVQVPHVNTAEDAGRAVAAVKFGPGAARIVRRIHVRHLHAHDAAVHHALDVAGAVASGACDRCNAHRVAGHGHQFHIAQSD